VEQNKVVLVWHPNRKHLGKPSHSNHQRASVRSDSLAERGEFELPVPIELAIMPAKGKGM
jgi:hypothetical protein